MSTPIERPRLAENVRAERPVLIARGLLTPKRKLDPGDPTPTGWIDAPTLRMGLLDVKRALKEANGETDAAHEKR